MERKKSYWSNGSLYCDSFVNEKGHKVGCYKIYNEYGILQYDKYRNIEGFEQGITKMYNSYGSLWVLETYYPKKIKEQIMGVHIEFKYYERNN